MDQQEISDIQQTLTFKVLDHSPLQAGDRWRYPRTAGWCAQPDAVYHCAFPEKCHTENLELKMHCWRRYYTSCIIWDLPVPKTGRFCCSMAAACWRAVTELSWSRYLFNGDMVDRGSQAIDILIESERHFNCEPPDNGWLEKKWKEQKSISKQSDLRMDHSHKTMLVSC